MRDYGSATMKLFAKTKNPYRMNGSATIKNLDDGVDTATKN
jgi:hypothetical protein